ncbi:MAG: hypothetical protein NC205_01960 [Prevotella sp.]|nr:hypothetical protein [Alistipes senegalensis]MCM1357331.1 hypothetical protein [Prevotella sp.]MCM1473040.1 hypothetical protein [Muribaculaceae bacterium]
MKFTDTIREIFRRKSQTNFSLAIYSVIIAVAVWFAVSLTLYPSVPKTIENVTLDLAIGSTAASDSTLSVISCNTQDVKVKVIGSRTQIANIDSDTISAYVDTDNVYTTGRKNLPIKVKSTNGIEFEVSSIEPSTAEVVFDKYESVQFPVQPKIPNVKFDENKTINSNEFSCEPNIVTITGPSSQIKKISNVYAVSNREMTLDSSHALSSDEIQLFSEDNTVIDPSSMTFDTTNFLINIPVLTVKEVGVYVQIVNAPASFDQNALNLKMSTNTIKIASKNSQTEIPDKLEIGKILLSDITPDFSKTFDISTILETQNCINMSDTTSITVTTNSENLTTKGITLDQSRINISNAPDEYDYKVITQSLNLEIAGDAETIEKITPNDIVADVNLLNASITEDQFTYDVIFSCPKYDNIWAITNYKVSIQRTPKETTTYSNTIEVTQTTTATTPET